MELDLVKYHGLGNDFLVQVGGDGAEGIDAALARALCDRHRGVGADGVLHVSALGAGRVRMELRNADGGLAETSGNGLRCAVLAAVHSGMVAGAEMVVETLAGTVRAEVVTPQSYRAGLVRVEMGEAAVGPELALSELVEPPRVPGEDLPAGGLAWHLARDDVVGALAGAMTRRVAVGNPHLVLYRAGRDDRAALRIDRLGPALEASVAGGVNVEIVGVPAGGDTLLVDVWERGVGITLACGSGSCAAAAASRAAGLVGDVVHVVNPGGTLLVELSGDLLAPSAVLTGPARRVGRVLVDTDELFASVSDGVGPDGVRPDGVEPTVGAVARAVRSRV